MATYTINNPQVGNIPKNQIKIADPNFDEIFRFDVPGGTIGIRKGNQIYNLDPDQYAQTYGIDRGTGNYGQFQGTVASDFANRLGVNLGGLKVYNSADLVSRYGLKNSYGTNVGDISQFQNLNPQVAPDFVRGDPNVPPVEQYPGQFKGYAQGSPESIAYGQQGQVQSAAQPSAQPPVSIPFRAGLSPQQQSGIANLVANKPMSQWTDVDKKNWAYATGNQPVPAATLTNPQTGEKKVVTINSAEASGLLKAGWSLGAGSKVGGTILTSKDLVDEPNIDLGSGTVSNGSSAIPVQSTIAASAETSKSINDYLKMIQMPETDASRQSSELTARVNELLGETAGQSQALAQEEERLGVRKLQETLTSINNEIGIKTAALNQRLAELQQTPQTMTRLSGAEAAARRVAQADLMFLQASAQAAMNNISFAKETAQAAVDQKYNPILEELNIKLKQLDIVNSSLSKDEAKYADALKLYLQDQASVVSEQKKTQSDINSLVMEVISNNPSIAKDRIVDQMRNAGSAVEAMQIAGQLATGSGYQYVQTPAELTKFRNAGYEIVNLGGRMYARPGEVVATGGRSGSSGVSSEIDGVVSDLTQSIIDNPSLFDDLTPTNRGKVLDELQANGYDTSNLGVKSLSDTAIQEIAQTQKALSDLSDLRSNIESNLQYIGPISGLQKLNPYSKARKIQADIDRVKQTVGKALEGGVLRKEDEEKYKKILATITDTPDTALYKIDALIDSVQKNIETYKSLQQSGGRSIDVKASLQKKGVTQTTNQEDLRKKYSY